jgi:pyruvate,orthophosphate dikinase
MGVSYAELRTTVSELHEANPLMGLRGCRLAVCYPEIGQMQTQAIIEAAVHVQRRPEGPLSRDYDPAGQRRGRASLSCVNWSATPLTAVIKEAGVELKYLVGTMIELPRAALSADTHCREAEFFSSAPTT